MTPYFSIIIPCYNQAHFLSDCLNSILVQSFADWEAIIVNDGSPDNTNLIAKKLTTKDLRIKLIEKENGGLSSARNLGIQNASGERIIFLDADDFLYQNCLIEIFNIAINSDIYDLIQYGYTYITEDKNKILAHVSAQLKKKLIPEIFISNLGPCHSICISSIFIKKIGYFDENLKSVEDWDFWIRAVKAGANQIIINKFLVYYRYSKNSMSRNPIIMYESLKEVIKRSTKKDVRIEKNNYLNKDYDYDTFPILNKVMIRSLGLLIMQGKIKEAKSFFENESLKSIDIYKYYEFEEMCSYLTFRYWYSKNEIDYLFINVVPYYRIFFKELNYNNRFINKAIFYIFKRHIFHKNVFKYGKYLGKTLNFITRKYYSL